ncbi:MAG: site-2 protease family protein [Planctomycetes bacterium]|nr:site-2 protease family protein [Planctomycetota bacterium]
MLAMVRFTPFLVAVLIGWILCVAIHEFSHAVVAYWGGDRSVRARGYLTLNPLSYLHPITSILIPCFFLIMGGIPLPGGAVLIDRSALRSRSWESWVAAAGPASNILIFLLIAVVIHPDVGLVGSEGPPPTWARFLGVLALLQVYAVFLNLIPVPPFDGFGIIEPFLDERTRTKLANPQMRWIGLIIVFFVLFRSERAMKVFIGLVNRVLVTFGLPWDLTWGTFRMVFD